MLPGESVADALDSFADAVDNFADVVDNIADSVGNNFPAKEDTIFLLVLMIL
ncbi:hypothetical protein [Parabacteroides sp.]|uniref:hypothetical protein n=1 Tax=Parabacteroides sp. TaxID=1869337 RepID=UPI003080D1CD